jgi:hypothetical protein
MSSSLLPNLRIIHIPTFEGFIREEIGTLVTLSEEYKGGGVTWCWLWEPCSRLNAFTLLYPQSSRYHIYISSTRTHNYTIHSQHHSSQ